MHYALCTTQGTACYARKQVVSTEPSLSLEREQQFKYYWYAAKEAFNKEDYERAQALSEFCLDLNPEDAHTASQLGILYMGLGRIKDGQDYIRRAYELAPESYWELYCSMIWSTSPESDNQKTALVIRAIERAIQINPKDESALKVLSKLYIKSGKNRKALHTLNKLEATSGVKAESTTLRYLVYRDMRRPHKALHVLEDYLTINPQEPTILRYYVTQLWGMHPAPKGDIDTKIGQGLETLYQYYPDDADILNDYAYYLCTKQKQLDLAEKLSYRAITEEPTNPSYLDTYAWIMYQQGDIAMARMYINKALRAAPAGYRTKDLKKHYKTIYENKKTEKR